MPHQEFAMVFDWRRRAKLSPVFLNRADAMGADGNELPDVVLRERREILFCELLKQQVIAEPADGITCAFFLAQNAEAYGEIVHHAGEIGDNLTALGIVAAHTAQPQAVLLRAV